MKSGQSYYTQDPKISGRNLHVHVSQPAILLCCVAKIIWPAGRMRQGLYLQRF